AAGLREGEGPGAVQRVDAASSVAPLLADQLDGLLAFAPAAAAELAARGETAVTLSLAELGVTTRDQLYVTTEEALATRRPAVVAALRGEARGWREASHDHEAARDLAVDVYGAELDLDPAGQLELLRRMLTLMRPADGESPLQLSAESAAADAALLTRLGWPIGPAAFAVDVMAEVDTSGFALG
ncbi:MAG: ABC transporter substrate-binding protein, partial [Acidimicrobiales bacterium]